MSDDQPIVAPGSEPDRIYATAQPQLNGFRFDEAVARVFPDMISRSVPGYTTIIPLIGVITSRFVQPGSRCYDLGCSLGASLLAMRHGIPYDNCLLIGIDNSPAMLDRCQHHLALDDHSTPVELRCADILHTEIEDASVVTLNFTLQFIDPAERLGLLQRIHASMRPGGALILSEKLCFDDKPTQKTLEQLHYDFKRANGYSELEISQKRAALDRVLIPETSDAHLQRLRDAGFDKVMMWYQSFNFVSFLAIKSTGA